MSAASTHAAATRAPLAQRNEFIQILRFVAAALVLITHATFYYHERIDTAFGVWHAGEIGVPIFFAISGVVMVISSTRLASDAGGAREFMSRRLMRILPLYWLVTLAKVAIALAVPAVVNHNHFDAVHAIKSFLFIPAFNAAGEIRPIHGVGWTLLHEMFFYVVFAAMMWMRLRPALATSVLIAALVALGQALPFQSAAMQVATHPINLYFIVGMLIGVAIVRGLSSFGALMLAAVLLSVAIAKLVWPAATHFVPLDPLVLLLGCLMLGLAHWKTPPALDFPVALGDSSYAMYLFHPFIAPPVLMLVHKLAPGLGAIATIGLTAVFAIGVCHAIHLFVELPLNSWVKRTFKRRRAPALPLEKAT